MAENSEYNDSTGNELVVYKPHSLNLAKDVQDLQTPIRKLNPETRIVSNENMYAGGFYGIEFDEYGIDGVAYNKYQT